jgi:ribosomal protein L11 methylase PrmA
MRQAALLDSLRRTIQKLDWKPEGTEWADYAENTSYGAAGTVAKDELVGQFLADAGGERVWDLGANTGRFSRVAAGLGRDVVAWDIDPAAVERNYRHIRRDGEEQILPLVLDLANPSPGLGWADEERKSLAGRANADVVLALALVHHLAIGRNVPLERIAAYLATLAPNLIIEFVPKDDPMVRTLLATREDVFPDYTIEGFRAAFAEIWQIEDEAPVTDTPRSLFRMRRQT